MQQLTQPRLVVDRRANRLASRFDEVESLSEEHGKAPFALDVIGRTKFVCHVKISRWYRARRGFTLISTALLRGLRPSSGKGRFHGVVALWPAINSRVSIANFCLSYAFRGVRQKPIHAV